MKFKLIPFIIATALVACDTQENLDPKSVTDVKTIGTKTAVDTYIYENFQKPYNINVTYRWKDSDFEFNKYLYPPTQAKVIPLLEAIRKIWIEPYEQVGGSDFIKSVAPRQISLNGGANYSSTGVKTVGFADNGARITLFEVDNFSLTSQRAKSVFETVQHEYCHIINYKKNFSDDYKLITPNGYSSTWHLTTDAQAREEGFITAYSKANEMEDFAEMTMVMLTSSKTQFDAIINRVKDTTAKENLRKKEKFVADYFKNEWNIDIYELQQIISTRTAELLN